MFLTIGQFQTVPFSWILIVLIVSLGGAWLREILNSRGLRRRITRLEDNDKLKDSMISELRAEIADLSLTIYRLQSNLEDAKSFIESSKE